MKIIHQLPEVNKHITALVIGWGLFSILLGLFFVFDKMEASKEVIPSLAIPIILKIATLTFLIGLLVLSVPLFIWKIMNKDDAGK